MRGIPGAAQPSVPSEQPEKKEPPPASAPGSSFQPVRRNGVALTAGNEWAGNGSVRSAEYAEEAVAPMPTASRPVEQTSRSADQTGASEGGVADRNVAPAGRAAGERAVNIRVSPLALQGYCPVELARHGRWMPGDVRWTVVYRGRIYRLSGAQQRRQFLADPEKFVPANSGDDPVVSVGQKRSVPGQPAYCAIYHDRVYLFSSAATQAEFNADPNRYAAE
jgi:YHS domain-containing protein